VASGDIALSTPKTITVNGLEPIEVRIHLAVPCLSVHFVERGTAQMHVVRALNGRSEGLKFAGGEFSSLEVKTETGFAAAFAGLRSGGKKGLMQALVTLGLLNLAGGSVEA
jgi:hypothetical protein